MALVSIGEAASILGVCCHTLRRWEKDGKIEPAKRTPGGHRRFHLNKLLNICGFEPKSHNRKHVGYARVSSHGQKEDLTRQKLALENHLSLQHQNFEVIEDLGSGMNFRKKGLRKLLRMMVCGEVASITLTHRDRLLRFGYELIEYLGNLFDVEIIVLNANSLDDSERLSQDVLEIITVFSARLYGKRSHQHRHCAPKIQAA